MADEVKYKATMTRSQWRSTFLKAETTAPTHKASLKWLSALCAEVFDIAEVTINAGSGNASAKQFDKERGEERVTIELSRDAVQAIKLVSINDLNGSAQRPPANLLSRTHIFESLKEVGPNGTLLRLVQKEAVLPDSQDLDEDKLDLDSDKDKV